jgi:G:T/U-mismatch repair DNA glycosylase
LEDEKMSLIKLAAKLVSRSGGTSFVNAALNVAEKSSKAMYEHGKTRQGKKALLGVLQNFKKAGRNKEIINKMKPTQFKAPHNKTEDILESSMNIKAYNRAKKMPSQQREYFGNLLQK